MPTAPCSPLSEVRILGAINGTELFGHERGNIEAYRALRDLGAKVRIGVNAKDDGGAVAALLRQLNFDLFSLPFGAQWSWQWLKAIGPKFAWDQLRFVFSCSRIWKEQAAAFKPTHFMIGSELVYSFLLLALRKCCQPLIWRMGDCPSFDSKFNFRIWKSGMKRATKVVAISEYVKGQAIRGGLPEEKISVIHNLAPDFAAGAAIDEAGPHPSLEADRALLLYVGAVAEHKGLLLLAEAFAKLAPEDPALRLAIVGGSQYDGEFRSRLRSHLAELGISHAVELPGASPNPALWYSKAVVHVAPSICEEALGNVVLEAKRAGAPSVVFPSGGLPEAVRHKIDGYVCEEKSVASLTGAIRWMLSDPARLSTMRRAAMEDSEARFGRARFLRQWGEVCR